MLAVRVHGDHGLGAEVNRGLDAGAQRRADPAVDRVPDHDRAGLLGQRAGLVARAVVDDHHAIRNLHRATHDFRYRERLVVGGYDDDPLGHERRPLKERHYTSLLPNAILAHVMHRKPSSAVIVRQTMVGRVRLAARAGLAKVRRGEPRPAPTACRAGNGRGRAGRSRRRRKPAHRRAPSAHRAAHRHRWRLPRPPAGAGRRLGRGRRGDGPAADGTARWPCLLARLAARTGSARRPRSSGGSSAPRICPPPTWRAPSPFRPVFGWRARRLGIPAAPSRISKPSPWRGPPPPPTCPSRRFWAWRTWSGPTDIMNGNETRAKPRPPLAKPPSLFLMRNVEPAHQVDPGLADVGEVGRPATIGLSLARSSTMPGRPCTCRTRSASSWPARRRRWPTF